MNLNEIAKIIEGVLFVSGEGVEIDEFKTRFDMNDREFNKCLDILKQKYNEEILRHMTELAASFNIKTVAEGCETAQNLSFLKKINCNIAQGFFFDKPLSLENFIEKYLTNKNSALTSKTSA